MFRDVRDALLAIHALAWGIAVVISAFRTGSVPPEMWGILPFGVGAILAAFKVESYHRRNDRQPELPPLKEGESSGSDHRG